MKILITGSNGLLGQKIVKLCIKYKIVFIATSKGTNRNPDCPENFYFNLDICNKLEINNLVDSFHPTHLIHTAAITDVDKCELNKELSYETNVLATKYLFESCQRHLANFCFLSTDFVFDGTIGNYSETDKVNPISYYGKCKVEAENILINSSYKNWTIARTIIVYGQAKNMSRSNLVLWVYESLQNNKQINVVTDQFRTPTWAEDLAWACLELSKQNKKGIFHISGNNYVSMFEFANIVARFFNLNNSLIHPITSKSLNQSAKRPPKTGFDITKSKNEIGFTPKSINNALKLFEF